MNCSTQSLTVMGIVQSVTPDAKQFEIKSRSGDPFHPIVTSETEYEVLTNLDGVSQDSILDPPGIDQRKVTAEKKLARYVRKGDLVVVQGVYQKSGKKERLCAKRIHIPQVPNERAPFVFEVAHWWLKQVSILADQWLDSLFGDRRDYLYSDFVALYKTTLNILGLPTDETTQECAVLSRLIYGFSAAYLLTGVERYRRAAEAGVKFQREAFRSLSHDNKYCFWAYGRRKTTYGSEIVMASKSADDSGSIALYEQIYALAGMTLYYRISQDREVLEDIHRTIQAFEDFFLDDTSKNQNFPGKGGYFSHLDATTLLPDRNPLEQNNNKKNWNSVGDHIPAYLVNLILALEPLPQGVSNKRAEQLLTTCKDMLERVTGLIIKHFPDKNPKIPFVNERFKKDWEPDHSYSWQQNRAIIGHNFKIAWNLTRVANYYRCQEEAARRQGGNRDEKTPPERLKDQADRAKEWKKKADSAQDVAFKLLDRITRVGVDTVAGGCFDAVEREPEGASPINFVWGSNKDFWQQEQAILAYLIIYGHTRKDEHLALAREMETFWNIFFLDREHRGMFFRLFENGTPELKGGYGVRGGHSDVSGYHVFELNFLAHIYNRTYVATEDAKFVLHFRPNKDCGQKEINVLPDFFPPGALKIEEVIVNGVARDLSASDRNDFQIKLDESELGSEVVVEFVST